MTTQMWATVDYDRPGFQTGDICLPHSVHRSAYGVLTIPVAVLSGGPGPTVLLTGGTHGDEYEGPLAIRRLLRTLTPDQVRGRIIALPMLNSPAFRAGLRTSPEDGGNLNRAYPGDASSGPTAAIAHYVSTVLLPMSDFFHDLHAGGASLQYLPFVSMRRSNDAELDASSLEAARVFGSNRILVWDHSPDPRLSTAEANRQRVPSLGGEFGGGGSVSRAGIEIAERGLRRLLVHWGLLGEPLEQVPPGKCYRVAGRDDYVYATSSGVFEPLVDLGDRVAAGALCGRIWSIDDLATVPVDQFFRNGGTVFCLRHPGLAQRGDCLAHLASEFPS
ncbi:succinylglutamate desuccinylase/aspartoacylase family protein [Seohaeicola nanhaiensis]|uniref:Succinylglutamate desuccinylase/aspartoacylase family protein n=1 Tax=Seohaeicola nanhaiensis TaxID=1387282 RepID=A0ABV9KC48_9RHOB